MTNIPKIKEEIIKEFEEKFVFELNNGERAIKCIHLFGEHPTEELKSFLSSALDRVHNAAVDECIEALPEEENEYQPPSFTSAKRILPADFVEGFNDCRTQALAKLQALKGEKSACNHKWREIEKGEGDYREFGKQCIKCNEVIWDSSPAKLQALKDK